MNRITRMSGRQVILYVLGVIVVALIALFIAMNVLRASNKPVDAAISPSTTSAPKAADNSAQKQSDKAAADKAAKEKTTKDKAAKEKAARKVAAREQAVASQEASPQAAPLQSASQRSATTGATTSQTQPTTTASTTPSQTTTPSPAAVPSSTAIYLTVPKMGISNSYVANTSDPSALDNGAIKLPQTGFPWQSGANTYIAGHVLGYRGTGSYLQFANLPNMSAGDMIYLTDANGTTYNYRVFRTMIVSPYDTYVTSPVPGQTVVTLQTCVDPPAYDQRFIVQGELVSTS